MSARDSLYPVICSSSSDNCEIWGHKDVRGNPHSQKIKMSVKYLGEKYINWIKQGFDIKPQISFFFKWTLNSIHHFKYPGICYLQQLPGLHLGSPLGNVALPTPDLVQSSCPAVSEERHGQGPWTPLQAMLWGMFAFWIQVPLFLGLSIWIFCWSHLTALLIRRGGSNFEEATFPLPDSYHYFSNPPPPSQPPPSE